jgi:hypothetical protein
MALRKSNGLIQFLNGGELIGIHAPSPPPCPSDGEQDVWILGLALGAVPERADMPLFTASGAPPKWLWLIA